MAFTNKDAFILNSVGRDHVRTKYGKAPEEFEAHELVECNCDYPYEGSEEHAYWCGVDVARRHGLGPENTDYPIPNDWDDSIRGDYQKKQGEVFRARTGGRTIVSSVRSKEQ